MQNSAISRAQTSILLIFGHASGIGHYTTNPKYTSLIALDTHARTTTAKGMVLSTGEVRAKRFNDCPTPERIAGWIRAKFTPPYYAAYESGCTGFHLCRVKRPGQSGPTRNAPKPYLITGAVT